MSVGVVYLARAAEGLASFERFARSYREQAAGCDHELIVIYKGFDQQAELQRARAVFADAPHTGVELPDTGFDIGSYLTLSRRVDHEYLCFLNTHTELAAAGWLGSLMRHARREGVGITGATASYESLFDTILLMRKVRWACDRGLGEREYAAVLHYYDFQLQALEDARQGRSKPPTLFARFPAGIKNVVRYPWYRWLALSRVWPGQHLIDIRQFPDFPNPHVRSNGFVVRRAEMLRFEPSSIASKSDATIFESGRNSLTAGLRGRGLTAIVVGRDGSGHDVRDWTRSGTFRLGDQPNLLLTDNQSRAYAAISPGARITHARVTWGDYLAPAPADFPDLGFAFRRTAALA